MNKKIQFWRRLSTNKKMIFAIPQIIEMIDMLEQQEKRIAELEKGLELAIPILNSAYKQHWDGAFNAWDICNNLAKSGNA